MKKVDATYTLIGGLLLATGFLSNAFIYITPFNLLHELGHALVGMWFGKVEELTLTYCLISVRNPNAFNDFLINIAGYSGEAWMCYGLFYLLTAVLRSPFGWLFFGAAHGTLVYTFAITPFPQPDIPNMGTACVILLIIGAALLFSWRTAVRLWRTQLHPPDRQPVYNYFSHPRGTKLDK